MGSGEEPERGAPVRSMLSLKRFMTEIEEHQERFRVACDVYASALRLVGEHAPPVQPDLVNQLRSRLAAIRRALEAGPDREQLAASGKQLELVLKEFAGAASQVLDEREKEIRAIIETLAEATQSLASQSEAHTTQLARFTHKLESISHIPSLTEIRRRLGEEVERLRSYVSTVRQQHESSIEQMRRELDLFRERLERAEALAFVDALTGVSNRAEGERRMAALAARGGPFSILFFDLNGFKLVNDRWGHTAGDLVLKTFARRLAQNVRPGDTVCRWGGDEFLVILPDCRLTTALQRAKQLAAVCSGSFTLAVAGQDLVVNVSAAVGAAEFYPGESVEDLVARADKFLYREKECPMLTRELAGVSGSARLRPSLLDSTDQQR